MGETSRDLLDAQDIQTAWDILIQSMLSFGFDRLMYGMTRFRQGNSVGTLDDFLVLTNYCPDYTKSMFEDGGFLRGPMARWALSNIGSKSWSMIREKAAAGTLTAEETAQLDLNMRMGLKAGYSISFSGPSDRYAAAISLVAKADMSQDDVDVLWSENGDMIEFQCKLFNLKAMTLPHETARKLTKRQKEVLDWVGDGKSVADVAIVMGLTQATVEKHLRLARQSMNSETTAQAVLKHALQNQLFLSD